MTYAEESGDSGVIADMTVCRGGAWRSRHLRLAPVDPSRAFCASPPRPTTTLRPPPTPAPSQPLGPSLNLRGVPVYVLHLPPGAHSFQLGLAPPPTQPPPPTRVRPHYGPVLPPAAPAHPVPRPSAYAPAPVPYPKAKPSHGYGNVPHSLNRGYGSAPQTFNRGYDNAPRPLNNGYVGYVRRF